MTKKRGSSSSFLHFFPGGIWFILGDGNEDRMEQSVLEALIQTLPNDLAEYVTQDNRAFEAERSKWDHDQEEKKKQEAVAKMDAESSGGDAGNELMVGLELSYFESQFFYRDLFFR